MFLRFLPESLAGKSVRVRAGLAGAALLTLGAVAPAQYQVHQWFNFEEGTVPSSALQIGLPQNLEVVKLSSVAGMPPAFHTGKAAEETGQYAVRLRSAPDRNIIPSFATGLATDIVLDRDRLGARGTALFQADFFVPAGGDLPSIAVLAMEPPKDAVNGRVEVAKTGFYRFGFTKGKSLYFSSVLPGKANAAVFHQDPALLQQIPAPGWHRFAIMLEGADKIRCYIDGRETAFSPITEPTLRKLVVGVMLADRERSYDAYVDNLSIQESAELSVLPESPYSDGWAVKASGATLATNAPPALNLSRGGWVGPVEAWRRAQSEQKPMLLYFALPGTPGTARLDEVFANDAAAQTFLSRHVATRIDVNQLQGGTIAKKYQVYKAPTLLVISPDARSYKRSVPGHNATWPSIESELSLR